MSDNICELMSVLEDKLSALEQMRSILEDEQRNIVELKAAEVEELSSRKEEATERIQKLNERCRPLLIAAFRDVGLPDESNLSSLIARLKHPARNEVIALQSNIIRTANKVEELVAVNKGLLERSLNFIERSMGFFRGMFSKGGLYGSTGRMLEAPPGARLIRREM